LDTLKKNIQLSSLFEKTEKKNETKNRKKKKKQI